MRKTPREGSLTDDVRAQLSAAIEKHLKASAKAGKLVRGCLIATGAGIAGIAQFMDFGTNGPSMWQILGVVATILVFLGGLYLAVAEENAAGELEAARVAVERAKDAENMFREATEDYKSYQQDILRANALYLCMQTMRGALERSDQTQSTAADIAKNLVNAAHPWLPQALGFEMHHRWTIGVYEARIGSAGQQVLVLLEKIRAVDCEISKAREWPTNTGYMGAAFTNRKEILIENANDPSMLSVFSPASDSGRPHDAGRYVSYAIVPILIGPEDAPWGIAIATNNEVGHFSPSEGPGVHAAEGIRALAGMMALGATFIKADGVTAKVAVPIKQE
jgi:hypothetical protein